MLAQQDSPAAAGGGGGRQKKLIDLDPAVMEPTPSRLDKGETSLVDLASALSLAGVRNPQILLARERIVEATALRQLAAARFLPSLHFGTSYDNHDGNLQQSTGNILKVDRSSLYLGAGATQSVPAR